MKRILIPTERAEDWRRLLASPQLHWKPGFSAMTLALAWEHANGQLPPEVSAALAASGKSALVDLKPLMIVPEYKIPLPGGRRGSQSDVFVLATNGKELVTMVVEGKVDEPFGPTVGEWKAVESEGRVARLAYILQRLRLPSVADNIRYQLLHRAVSAVLAAEQFFAAQTVMLVHSFSPSAKWLDDFHAFTQLFGKRPAVGEVVPLGRFGRGELVVGWCSGEQRFRNAVPVPVISEATRVEGEEAPS